MARQTTQGIGAPSLLDRLIDREPRVREEPPTAHAMSLRGLKTGLRRDLEWLLNSRRAPIPLPDSADVTHSVLFYGLPDVSGLSFASGADQNKLIRVLESTIAAFEPRLQNVVVTLKPVAGGSKVLKFQIEALLRVEPAPERVFFDTTLELTSGEYAVEGDARA